jgi:hypothetical protein
VAGALKRLEDFLRGDDPGDWELVIRGRQFDPARLLADALDMVELYSWKDEPVAAVSASVVHRGQTIDELLSERRLRTRRDVVIAPVAAVVAAGFPGARDLRRTPRQHCAHRTDAC